MKNIAKIALLTLIFAVPIITHAAWWNPLTWSWITSASNAPQAIEEGTPNVDLPPVKDQPLNQNTPQPTDTGKSDTKIETKIVYVDNPALSTQIKALMSDNKALNEQILNLQGNFVARLNACKDSLSRASVSSGLSKDSNLQPYVPGSSGGSGENKPIINNETQTMTTVDTTPVQTYALNLIVRRNHPISPEDINPVTTDISTTTPVRLWVLFSNSNDTNRPIYGDVHDKTIHVETTDPSGISSGGSHPNTSLDMNGTGDIDTRGYYYDVSYAPKTVGTYTFTFSVPELGLSKVLTVNVI